MKISRCSFPIHHIVYIVRMTKHNSQAMFFLAKVQVEGLHLESILVASRPISRFPKMGLPLVIIHFRLGFPQKRTTIFWGSPMAMESPLSYGPDLPPFSGFKSKPRTPSFRASTGASVGCPGGSSPMIVGLKGFVTQSIWWLGGIFFGIRWVFGRDSMGILQGLHGYWGHNGIDNPIESPSMGDIFGKYVEEYGKAHVEFCLNQCDGRSQIWNMSQQLSGRGFCFAFCSYDRIQPSKRKSIPHSPYATKSLIRLCGGHSQAALHCSGGAGWGRSLVFQIFTQVLPGQNQNFLNHPHCQGISQ